MKRPRTRRNPKAAAIQKGVHAGAAPAPAAPPATPAELGRALLEGPDAFSKYVSVAAPIKSLLRERPDDLIETLKSVMAELDDEKQFDLVRLLLRAKEVLPAASDFALRTSLEFSPRPVALPKASERQLDVLRFMDSFIRENGVYPSQKEIAEALGIPKQNVALHLQPLEKKGYLVHQQHGAWHFTNEGLAFLELDARRRKVKGYGKPNNPDRPAP